MYKSFLLLIDLLCIAFATVLALILRDNLEFSWERIVGLAPYLGASVVLGAVTFSAAGINRCIWRFTSLSDYMRIAAVVTITAIGSTAFVFSLNNLEGVPRSIPILQVILASVILTSIRIFARLLRAKQPRVPVTEGVFPFKKKTVLVLGVSWTADIFLRTVREAGGQHISVAGVICPQSAHRGRLFQSYPVLGTPEELPNILRELNTHGVAVDEIVITTPFEKLSPDTRDALVYVEANTNINIEHFGDNIKFIHNESQRKVRTLSVDAAKSDSLRLSLQDIGTSSILGRSFWKFKRAFDILLSLILIAFTAPLFFIVTLVVFLDVGCPILFWQQRPGRFGRNFKVYKFRTMKSAYDSEGRHIPDNERTSAIGRFIRHTRLDELPQLFHILFGQMSFIGPRPLLPIDQDDEHSARLAVRPGLTGWAQVNGGREVSIADKAAMDIWYVHNASFALDFKIAISTVYTIVLGERPNPNAIREAWLYLRNTAISEVAAGPVDGHPDPERWVA